MIVEVKDYNILWRISRLIDKGIFKQIDCNGDDFFRYLIDEFDREKIKVYASVNGNKKMEGFVVCSLSKSLVTNKPEVFIDLAYVDKDADKNIGKELLNKVEDYSRSLGIDKITGYSLKGERSMLKKYGFDLEYKSYCKTVKPKEAVKNVIHEKEEDKA